MRALFLCTRNSARSQIGEALLRHVTQGRVEVHSAGTEPGSVHPYTLIVLEEIGLHHDARAKSVDEFAGQRFDLVVTTCDEAREACPVWPGAEMVHWNIPDPAAAPEDQRLEAFRRTRNQMLMRLLSLVEAHSLA